jgi:RNA polymerase sigma-70 factor, ECF subfamily
MSSISATHEVTRLLAEWAKGNERALDELTPLVYQELRQLAASCLRKERQGHTLQPTALVHEAYLRLVDQRNPSWQSRSHFFGVAARLMRQILVDHARRRAADKRGGGQESLPLDEALDYLAEQKLDVLAVHEALTELAGLSERQSQVVELRFFGGYTVEEIAELLEVSVSTVESDFRKATAFLRRRLAAGDGDDSGKA